MRRKRRNNLLYQDDGDPLSVVVNLFDVAMVFAVALMVAMVMHMNMTEIFGQEIETYKASGKTIGDNGQKGKRLGTAYQLDNGQIIYVPDQ